MPDADDENHEAVVLNLVDDAVVAHTNAPEIVEAGELPAAGRARMASQGVDGSAEAVLLRAAQSAHFAAGDSGVLDGVGGWFHRRTVFLYKMYALYKEKLHREIE